MHRQTFSISTLALVALAAFAAAAEQTHFWVSVGSFKSPEAAQRASAAAAATLSEPLQTLRSEGASGVVFRVVRGPYGDRDAADEQVFNARAHGYADAWVLRASTTARAGEGSAPSAVGDDAGATQPLDAPDTWTESAAAGLTGDYADIETALAADAALDLNFAALENFDDFAALADLDDLEPDNGEDLANRQTGQRAPQTHGKPTIKPTEEPALEAPSGYALHRLPRTGDAVAGAPLPPDGSEESAGAICRIFGWLPFVKSCDGD